MSLQKINLPIEIIIKIFENLDLLDLKNTRITCKSFRDVADYVLTMSARARFSVKLYRQVKDSVIIYGGCTDEEFLNWPSDCEIIGKSTNSNLKLPPLPQKAANKEWCPILVYDYNHNRLMFIGSRETWVFKSGKWQFHSQFESPRNAGFAVVMPDGIYLFDKILFNNACETEFRYLPPNGQSWTICSAIFPKSQAMDRYTCGLAISSTEFVILRDFETRLIKCNTVDGTCTEMGNLQDNRRRYTGIVFNGKIIVCGGYKMINHSVNYFELAKSTEIIQLEVLQKSSQQIPTSQTISRKVGDINFPRNNPAMGIVKVDGKSKVILFGGGQPVEEWDDKEEIWRVSTNLNSTKRAKFFAHC